MSVSTTSDVSSYMPSVPTLVIIAPSNLKCAHSTEAGKLQPIASRKYEADFSSDMAIQSYPREVEFAILSRSSPLWITGPETRRKVSHAMAMWKSESNDARI